MLWLTYPQSSWLASTSFSSYHHCLNRGTPGISAACKSTQHPGSACPFRRLVLGKARGNSSSTKRRFGDGNRFRVVSSDPVGDAIVLASGWCAGILACPRLQRFTGREDLQTSTFYKRTDSLWRKASRIRLKSGLVLRRELQTLLVREARKRY